MSNMTVCRLGSLIAVTVLLTALLFVPAGWSQTPGSESPQKQPADTPRSSALQAASLLHTIPYGAAKLGFSLVGGFAGGVVYALSGGDLAIAKEIWSYFMKGTYVLTPEHLKGNKPVHFVGPRLPPESAS